MSGSLLEPADEESLAGMVRNAHAAGEPLMVQGGGTKLSMLRPVQAAHTLTTRGLTGFSLYAPKELVMSAAAGTAVADVEAKLAEHGQQLIAEPPDLSRLLSSSATNASRQTLGGYWRRIGPGLAVSHGAPCAIMCWAFAPSMGVAR